MHQKRPKKPAGEAGVLALHLGLQRRGALGSKLGARGSELGGGPAGVRLDDSTFRSTAEGLTGYSAFDRR